MALESTLKDYPITEMFQFLGRERKTGVVKVRDNDNSISVSFVNGMIVGAESTVREKKEHLGEMLVRANLINKQDLTKALTYQKETLQRLGDILVKHKMISADDLRDMIQLQITETIYALLKWTKGDSKFIEQNVEYDKANIAPIPSEQILMDGVRRLDEWPKIKRVIKSFDMVFQKSFGAESKIIFEEMDKEARSDDKIDAAFAIFDEPPKKSKDKSKGKGSKQKKLDKLERRVFSLVDGKHTVQKIIELSMIGEFDTCKTLVTLIEEGLIEISVEEKSAKEVKGKYDIIETIVNIFFLFLFIFIFYMVSTSVDFTDVTSISNGYFFEVKKDDVLKEVQSFREIDRLNIAIHLYYLRNNKYPHNLEALIDENLVKESDIIDPWGIMYLYKKTDSSFILEKVESASK